MITCREKNWIVLLASACRFLSFLQMNNMRDIDDMIDNMLPGPILLEPEIKTVRSPDRTGGPSEIKNKSAASYTVM